MTALTNLSSSCPTLADFASDMYLHVSCHNLSAYCHILKLGMPSKEIEGVRMHNQNFEHTLNYHLYVNGMCVNFAYIILHIPCAGGVQRSLEIKS
jgi:hypothetical protein